VPKLHTATMHVFIDAFAAANPLTFHGLLRDNRAVHPPERLRLPANVALVFLPPYSPELNPGERRWQDLRGRMAWRIFDDRDALEAERCTQRDHDTPSMVHSLTNDPSLRQAIDAVGPWPHAADFAECSI
jgi:transposase